MPRVLLVSNRLPVCTVRRDGEVFLERNTGGLASRLASAHRRSRGVWVGWPGNGGELTIAETEGLADRAATLRLAPVTLTRPEVEGFHEQFCSGVLWPVLHDLVGQLPMHIAGFEIYEAINRRFAEAIVASHRSGDVVWVHDYHLMLVPQLVRERLPQARIGFFLHVPFPGPDLFRVLPFREKLLAGLLGADLIGFQTAGYMRHFAASTLRTLGASMELDRLRWQGREVRAGVFPMGVDVRELERLTESPGVEQRVREIRGGQAQVIRTLVGIDRLDYTKGIPRRLLAFQTMLRRHPELCGQVKLLQVVLPSRTEVDRYREIRDQVHTLIGRINGDLGTPGWSPVHYIYRSESPEEVVSLYRAADAMLVTPLRDGMNLVAKEFVASRTDEDGVLVLSEFAGAASDLAEALLVNPYDIEGMAQAFHGALVMSAEERRSRMRALRQRVLACDVQRWSRRMLEALCEKGPAPAPGVGGLRADAMAGSLERARGARPLVLLLDYDGTLVPFAQTPDLAVPDVEVLDLLEALSARPHTQVHVVSGRCRQSLERWLGGLTVHLHAEHGLWSRPAGGVGHAQPTPPQSWRGRVLRILQDYAERTPGSLVETKPAGLAWHYRAANAELGARTGNELRLHLQELLSNAPVEIMAGDKVVEIRPHGVHKGRIVPAILEQHPGALLLAIGDDRTDEDLFAALPGDGISIRVGVAHSLADLRLQDVSAVRALLRALCEDEAAGARFSAA